MPETVLRYISLTLSRSPHFLLTWSSTPSQAAETNLRRQLEQTLAAEPSSPLHHYNLVGFLVHCIEPVVAPALLRCA